MSFSKRCRKMKDSPSEYTPWFNFPLVDPSFSDMAEWASIAALTVPPTKLPEFYPIIEIKNYNRESMQLEIAQEIMRFFVNGFWRLDIRPELTVNLSFRLQVVSAFLNALHQEDKRGIKTAPFCACIAIACLAAKWDENGLLLWFSEQNTPTKTIHGAACLNAEFMFELNNSELAFFLSNQYDSEAVENRRKLDHIDKTNFFYWHPIIGVRYTWLASKAKEEGLSFNDALSKAIISYLKP